MSHIIVLICCILCGFLVGRFVQKRILAKSDMYADLVKYVAALKLNVNGKQVELATFNATFAESCTDVFRACLLERKFPALKKQQQKAVESFFADLNCTSGSQLLQHLDFYEPQFAAEHTASLTEAKKSSLYVKVGLLLGAMLGILFI